MFCKNCGAAFVAEEAVMCVNCGCQRGTGFNYCQNCGKPTNPESVVCLNCGVSLVATATPGPDSKSKLVAALLAFFLGCFGVHNFYLGYTGKAVAQLLITLLSCFILSWGSWIWALVEMIMLLTGSISADASGKPLTN